MTVSIVIPDANFTKFVTKTKCPHYDTALGLYLFGGSEADSLLNRAKEPAVSAASVIGAPVYGDGYATLTNANGFNSGIDPGNQFTYIGVLRAPGVVGTSWGFGAWPGGNLLYGTQVTSIFAINGSSKVTDNTVGAGAGPNFRLQAATYDGANAKIYTFTGAANPILKTAAYVGAVAAGNVRFGGNTLGTHLFDMAVGMIFPVALTQEQITEIYDYLKAYEMPRRGLGMV